MTQPSKNKKGRPRGTSTLSKAQDRENRNKARGIGIQQEARRNARANARVEDLYLDHGEEADKRREDFRAFMANDSPLFPKITDKKKRAAIWALRYTGGIVQSATKMARFSAESHAAWARDDADYREAHAMTRETMLDLAESKLMERIRGVKVIKGEGVYDIPPDTTAIMFLLNNRGGSRGYGNRIEVKHLGEGGIIRPKCLDRMDKGDE